VAIFGPIPGILIAIFIALGEFVGDAWRPHHAVLGQPQEVAGYHDITRYPEAHLIPGLLLFRWDAPLFFANAEQFHERVLIEINNSPSPVRWFVVAAEPITDVDISAADMLLILDDELQNAGIELIFAELKDPVKDTFKRFGLWERFQDWDFFFTMNEAVDAYQVSNPAEKDDEEDSNRSG
jgi:MFS superfamily sulfate permease-like transporter